MLQLSTNKWIYKVYLIPVTQCRQAAKLQQFDCVYFTCTFRECLSSIKFISDEVEGSEFQFTVP